MIEATRAALSKRSDSPVRPTVDLREPEANLFLLTNRLPDWARKVLWTGATLAGAVSMAATCNGGDNQEDQTGQDGDNNSQPTKVDFDFPWHGDDPWYLTSGPHSDGLSQGVRYALDFAAQESVKCPQGEPLTNRWVIAAAEGTVTVAGDENNILDKNHSIVEIDHGNATSGYMHLANVKVQEGQRVKRGDFLGNPSCEVPPGGATSGIHLHFYVEKDGKPIPIEDYNFEGWRTVEDPANYEGKLTKSLEIRQADKRRCGPDVASILSCGGIKNYLKRGEVLGVRTTPAAPVATAQAPIEQPPSVEVSVSKEGVIDLGDWEIGILDWQESPYQELTIDPTNPQQNYREGWKYVTIKTRVKNVGNDIAIGGYLYYDPEAKLKFQIEAGGFAYDSYSLDLELGKKWVPRGFSYPNEINIWVPQTQMDYSLVVTDLLTSQQVSKIPKNIRAADFPAISPDANIKADTEIWDFPGVMSVAFRGTYVNVPNDELYVSLDIQNNYGQDLYTRHSENVTLQAYLPNGRVIESLDLYSIPYELRVDSIAPGLKKTKDLRIGWSDTDLSGSVIVLIYQDHARNNLGGRWAAWRLP